MKRCGKLFDLTFSQDNLYQAYLDARRGKRGKRDCFDFEVNLGGNLASLYCEIHGGEYRPRPYYKFVVHEPKPRLIHAPAFRDIVVQHAIYRVIYDIFDRTFITSSFACRKGYGTHKASRYVQDALRCYAADDYILKLDVRKFFYTIDRGILRSLIERKAKDRRLVEIMLMFADCDGPVGIPIGNLLSQLYALIYLNPVDHFVKRRLSVRHYVRYVDDMVLIGLSRDQAVDYRSSIVAFIEKQLRLTLSKSTIHKIKRGVNFVGYRTWQHIRIIRKYSLHKFKKKAEIGDRQAVVSILGHARQTDSLPYLVGLVQKLGTISLPKYYRSHIA